MFRANIPIKININEAIFKTIELYKQGLQFCVDTAWESRCGSLNTSRHSGFFECLCCGFHCDSDLQASFNISKRYMRNFGLVSVTRPNVSDGDCEVPILRGIEHEFRDKSPLLQ